MNVLITGASGGLGRALANECAGRGFDLFLTDINEEGLLALRRGLRRRFGVSVVTAACDLTSAGGVDALLAQIDSAGLRFDMLLNVAGRDFEGGFLEREREDLVQIVALNNEATLRITHAILRRRKEGQPFYLLFTSSLACMYPMPLKATYAASKRFLLEMALALGEELREQRVNVLALCPGGMPTTQGAMRRIAAQGFWGGVTANPTEVVCRRAIGRLLKRSGVYVPGVFNRALVFFGKLLPRRWVAAAICRRWRRAQKRWMPHSAQEAPER